jgi:hypothetical protein
MMSNGMKIKIMKTPQIKQLLAVFIIAGLASAAVSASAQDSSASNLAPTAANNIVAPQLAYGASEVLRLQQAAVGDSTIIAYVKNSPNSYALNADQIIYLRQKGVSDAVVSAMLNQPKTGVTTAASSSVTSSSSATTAYNGQVSTATVAPTVTYVQTVPATTYYYAQPYYQPYYYYNYGWYPPISLSFGWRGGGWHGGWRH